MTLHTRSRPLALSGIAALLALGLAACGSEDDGSADGGVVGGGNGGGAESHGAGGHVAPGGGSASDCPAACAALPGCDLCVTDGNGACVDDATCTRNCEADSTLHPIATCVVGAADCAAVGACLGVPAGGGGGGGDDDARACSDAGGFLGVIPGSCNTSCSVGVGDAVCPDGWDCNIGGYCAAQFDSSCLRCPQ